MGTGVLKHTHISGSSSVVYCGTVWFAFWWVFQLCAVAESPVTCWSNNTLKLLFHHDFNVSIQLSEMYFFIKGKYVPPVTDFLGHFYLYVGIFVSNQIKTLHAISAKDLTINN